MTEQPVDTIPKDRKILVKHEHFGWIEAQFDEQVYNQSIQQHGEVLGGFGWDSRAKGEWLYHRDITAWAELPEDAE